MAEIEPIALQVKTFNPATTMAELAQADSLQIEGRLKRQQIKESQARIANDQAVNQQKQRDLADQERGKAIISDPANHADFAAGNYSALLKGLSPQNAEPIIKSLDAMRTTAQNHDKEQSGIDAAARQELSRSLSTIDPADPNAATTANTLLQNFSQNGPSHAKIAAQLGQFDPNNFQADFKNKTVINNLAAGMLDYRANQKEVQGKIDSSAAQTADSLAKAKESGVKAAKDQFELDLMKGATNGSQDAAIDQRFAGNPEAAQAAKDAFRSNIPAGVKAATDAVNKVYEDRVGEAAKAKSLVPGKVAEQAALLPGEVSKQAALLPGEVRKAVATESATAPIKTQQSLNTARALAAQSPDAFAGIVDASARHSAENELDKTAKEYTDKLAASQQLLDTIHAAQAGNKAAPGVIPIEQVRSVLSNGRLNQAELKGVSSQAGSLMDRIEGWANKNTKGEPIPPDILRDTASLATIQQQAARRGYDAGIQRLKTRGVDVSKIAVPTISGGGGNIRARDPQGKLHEAPAGTALPAGWKLEP